MTTTRPAYVPSYVPHHCEVQHGNGTLCGQTPVIMAYVPYNNIRSAIADVPKTRIKFTCGRHGMGNNDLGTLEEIFKD